MKYCTKCNTLMLAVDHIYKCQNCGHIVTRTNTYSNNFDEIRSSYQESTHITEVDDSPRTSYSPSSDSCSSDASLSSSSSD